MPLLGRLLDIKNPLLGLGAVLLVLAFVDTSGSAFSPTTHPSYPLGGVGAVLLAVGVFLHIGESKIREKQRFRDPVLYDASFWHEVFDAMPPAFIKAVSADRQKHGAEHIGENESLRQFQGRGRAGPEADEERDIIRADHKRGDEEALANGKSLYMESSDTYGINPARQIVTLKTAVEHGGREFVVGWFVTVELPMTLGEGDTYRAKETGQQLTFGLIDAPDNEGIRITIGRGARLAAERKQSRNARNAASTSKP